MSVTAIITIIGDCLVLGLFKLKTDPCRPLNSVGFRTSNWSF